MRNKLNEQQNSKLAAHREVLLQRKEEMVRMDHRIGELQARLRKKKSKQQQDATTLYNNMANQNRITYNNNNNANTKLGNRTLSANIAAVEPYIKHAPADIHRDDVHDMKGFLGKQDPKYQTLPYSIKFPGSEKRLQGDANSNVYLSTEKWALEKEVGKYGEIRVDTSQPKSGKEVPVGKHSPIDILPKEIIQHKIDYKPSVGHAIAFEAMEETLKMADTDESSKSLFGIGYKPATSLTNFTPRPYGTTYSTSVLANRPSIITTTASIASPIVGNESVAVSGTGFPKTSTPIGGANLGNNDMKEIFITGAPTVTVPGRPYMSGGRNQGQPASSHSQPLTVVTSSVPSLPPSNSSPNSTTVYDQRTGQPLYQIASSRPQPQMQPQHTQDVPSPASTSSSASSGQHRVPTNGNKGNVSVSQTTPQSNFAPTSSTNDSRGYNQTHNSSGKSAESEYSSSSMNDASKGNHSNTQHNQTTRNGQNAPVSSAGGVPSSQAESNHSQQADKDRKTISTTSVSSALSVLMSGTNPTTQTNKPSYRYAPKSVIANTYMRRLGSNALDQYRKNMTALYKDFITTQTEGSENKKEESPSHGQPANPTATVRPLNMSSHIDQPDSKRPQSPQKQEQDGTQREGPPPYRGIPSYDLDAERMHYRPNAPKLRRRLSSGESDDLRQYQPKSVQRHFSQDDVFEKTADTTNSSNVVRVDNIQNSYDNNYQGDAKGSNVNSSSQGAPPDLPHSRDLPSPKDRPNMPLAKRNIKAILKKKGSVSSSRRVSFDPLALLLDASLEGELELVMRTAAEVSLHFNPFTFSQIYTKILYTDENWGGGTQILLIF